MSKKLDYFFEKYNFTKKDRFDTLQIFNLLSETKQKQFVSNFGDYASGIEKLENDLQIEKSILLEKGTQKVKEALLKKRKQKLDSIINTQKQK